LRLSTVVRLPKIAKHRKISTYAKRTPNSRRISTYKKIVRGRVLSGGRHQVRRAT
jgi:hypothetical protein